MEKKTKKLQLRKETIAVLNGMSMAHVIGGGGFYAECNSDEFCPDGKVCVKDPFDNLVCAPRTASRVNCTELQYTCSCNNCGVHFTNGDTCTVLPKPQTSGAITCINPTCK